MSDDTFIVAARDRLEAALRIARLHEGSQSHIGTLARALLGMAPVVDQAISEAEGEGCVSGALCNSVVRYARARIEAEPK